MEIRVDDFLNALVDLFDPEEGMVRRNRFLVGFLSDESAWPFLLEDLPTLAAMLSGVVGVSRLIDTAEFVDMLEAGLPDESTDRIERVLLVSLCIKPGNQHATVARLLDEGLNSVQQVVLAVYLQEARRYQAQQPRSVSYELYVPERRRE